MVVQNIQQFRLVADRQAEEGPLAEMDLRVSELVLPRVIEWRSNADFFGSSTVSQGASQPTVQSEDFVFVDRLARLVFFRQRGPRGAVGRGLGIEAFAGAVEHGFANVTEHRGQVDQAVLQGLERRADFSGIGDLKLDVEGCAGHLSFTIQREAEIQKVTQGDGGFLAKWRVFRNFFYARE